MEKVIHMKRGEKIEKSELYTKLYTLSTLKTEKKVVYIVKKGTFVLWSYDKVDKKIKKAETQLTFEKTKKTSICPKMSVYCEKLSAKAMVEKFSAIWYTSKVNLCTDNKIEKR